MRSFLPIAALALLALAPVHAVLAPAVLAQSVPTPLEHFGHQIGAEGFLADWNELGAYYEAVAVASPRVTIDTLGATTLGEPFLRLVVTSEENHGRLDRYLEIQTKLADPRRLVDDAELEALLEEGRTVVLLTSHIHSTEVAAGQMPARLLHRLATATDPETLEILDETILVLIPSLNPDGTQLVSEWWREWRGTEFEGAPLPRLYHHYIGHNNNRDWFFFAQQETLLTVLHAHNVWRPQIVHDVHQMGSGAARYFVPPYIDPVEPNVDPRLIAALNQLGKYMAAEMTRDGFDGVVTDAIFDIYTPARAYMHYHGGVRILSETASADGPMSIVQEFEDLGGTADYDAQEMSSNFPSPWRGGRWGMDDAVDYMEAGAMALLRNAAVNRRFWLENFVEIHRAAVEGWEEWPEAWVIPAGQTHEVGVDHLLRVLTTGDVEVHRAEEAFTVEGRTFPRGSYVIPMGQPYAAFAQTMLESQEYPDLRQYPGGPPVRPYDATAHTLPLLFGVEAVAVESMEASNGATRLSPPLAQRTEHTFEVPDFLEGPGAPRIGLYRAYQEPMPQGWTRWLFDEAGVPYEEVRNDDIRAGRLADRFDVLVFQDQSASSILTGHSPERMPPPYAGGVEREGVEALRAFVEAGGRLVAVDAATEFAIDVLELEIRSAVEGLSDTEFYIPGSILALDLDPDHPMAEGVPPSTMAWYWRTSRAFEVDDPQARVVGRFGEGDPRLAGWVLGAEHVAGRPALVEAEVGAGSVVLFGFQPNFRGQTVASWPLFLNSLR
jgi:hypothetical protein